MTGTRPNFSVSGAQFHYTRIVVLAETANHLLDRHFSTCD
jgi:hypothetical protein